MASVSKVIFKHTRPNPFRNFLHPTDILIFYVLVARDV